MLKDHKTLVNQILIESVAWEKSNASDFSFELENLSTQRSPNQKDTMWDKRSGAASSAGNILQMGG